MKGIIIFIELLLLWPSLLIAFLVFYISPNKDRADKVVSFATKYGFHYFFSLVVWIGLYFAFTW